MYTSYLRYLDLKDVTLPGNRMEYKALQYYGSDWLYHFRHGDYIAFRVLEKNDIIDVGEIYIIATKNDLRIKRILRISKKTFLVGSDSDKLEKEDYRYPHYEIDRATVVEIAQVVAVFSKF
jgi:hypothetical protein